MAATFSRSGDENVEIHLTSDKEDKIMLHSYVLALHSKWFKASLSERWNGGNNTATDDKHLWVYELRFDKDSDFGLLSRRSDPNETPPSTTETIPRKLPGRQSVAAKKLHKDRLDRVDAHKQMFGALYHIIPTFSHQSFDNARTSVKLLAEAADAYACQHVVKIHTENHLRLYRNEVLDLCASDPTGMLELAMAVQSEWVFMEASTNLIGRSSRFVERQEARLRDMGIEELIQKKRNQLRGQLFSCELDLFLIQPRKPSSWRNQMAMAYFRQWLSGKLRAEGGSNLGRGYAAVYRAIASRQAGIESDDEETEVNNFLRLFTKRDTVTMDDHLKDIFEDAAEVIAPILKDVTRRQNKDEDDPYRALTFMSIDDDEIPWAEKK